MLLVSQIFSPFLLSLSIWVIAYSCLVETGPNGWPRLDFPKIFQNLFKKPELLAISGLFWLSVASGIWSENIPYWLERSQVRLPFFILPFAFANRPDISKKQFDGLCAFFLAAISITGLGVLANFALHYEDVMNSLSIGGAVPVPRNHIRFSLLVAMGVAVGWQLFRRGFCWKNRTERWIWLAMAVFLLVLSHLLAVRTGLVAVYAVVFLAVVQLIFLEKNKRAGLILGAGLILMPIIFLKYSPALRTKIGYMIWDITRGDEFSKEGYSDTDRVVSLRGGWQIFCENPILGTGMGDLPTEMRRYVAENLPAYKKDVKLPHNQFLYVMAATGVVGLLVSLAAWIAPFFFRSSPREPLFGAAMLILFISFLVEYTIEGTYGAVFAAFFPIFFNMKIGGPPEISG